MRRLILMLSVLVGSACGEMTNPRIPPTAATVGSLGNARCPISGAPVAGTAEAPSFAVTYRGVAIGFMCPACVKRFEDAAPEEKDQWLAVARQSVVNPRRP